MATASSTPDPARRSERAYRAILDATGELIVERGFAATSIDQIAERAGVGKQTIYRWWPNKAALVLDYAQQAARPAREPDLGTLRKDLQGVAKELCAMFTRSPGGNVCVELVGSAQVDPRLAKAFRETFVSGRRATVVSVLERGQKRGEVRDDVNLETAADMLFGPIWYRWLVQHAPLNPAFARELANAVADAVGPR